MDALIFAAGLGTRLKPLTDTMPKALVPVGGIPLLERVATKLAAAGCGRIVINVHHFAQMIRDFVEAHDHFGVEVVFSDETDLLRETGGGIRHAGTLLADSGGPILIHNVDILSNLDIRAFMGLHRTGDLATLLVSERSTSRYFLFDDEGLLVGWTNLATGEVRSPYPDIDPDRCTRLAFSGIHCISPEIFPLMRDWPEKFPIVDFYLAVCRDHAIRAAVIPGLEIHDVGKMSALNFITKE